MNHISFKKILIPVNFSTTSHNAFSYVKWLGVIFVSEVTLLHVAEKWSYSSFFPTLPKPVEDYMISYKKMVMLKLEEYKQELLKGGIKTVFIEYLEGNVTSCICDYAIEQKIDIVVMGTHGSKGLNEFFIGSNAFKIVNSINIPVLSINKKSKFKPFKKILAPLDYSKHTRAKYLYISELASELGTTVEIIYPHTKDIERKNKVAKYLKQVSTFLQHKNIVYTSKEVEGNFAHEIIKYAEYANIDVIVIMSETETKFTNMLLSTKAQEIVNHSTVPVITLHTEDNSRIKDFFGQYF